MYIYIYNTGRKQSAARQRTAETRPTRYSVIVLSSGQYCIQNPANPFRSGPVAHPVAHVS